MLNLLLLSLSVCLLYVFITAFWNLYIHPLHHIPGPRQWIAFPILRHLSAIRGTLDSDLRRWHFRYGSAVRFGPDEASFITAEAWKDIYGSTRPQLPRVISSGSNTSDIINANDANHARYRKALAHAFSTNGVRDQEPLVIDYIVKLVGRLKEVAESKLPTDMVKWYKLTTFDMIGDLAFGEHFGGLEKSEYHHWVATVGRFTRIIPFLKIMDAYPVLFKVFLAVMPQSFWKAQAEQAEYTKLTVQKRLNSSIAQDRPDFMDSMLRHRNEKDKLSEHELESNASVLVLAGSETPADLLSGVTYWLLKTPEALEKATGEVRSLMKAESEITFSSVEARLPYLLACVNEGLRLYPSLPGELQRMSPDTPMKISGYDIPPRYAAYSSPTNFHDPDRFIPERWLPEAKTNPSSPYLFDNREVFQPFSVGPRGCIGKSLAYPLMRTIIARVLWNFDFDLCEESRSWHIQKTFGLWEKPPLICKLTQRRQS
ncbi:uncharacterized protein N7446_007820 [Penicillium canescens]|uniref:Cytochrome P450 n=1 Tax=Penicillium canescens TaxID=5083 RepID=A0AAD6IN12_PENCN|nr:uncharacterized protein N7446_007820 [Penicillium canescens]KAJ6056927.1 hypothetical protein N7460_000201 [Penicillium canescens]KAJ6058237.1 hypothetical protein N7446_007820 [Penicillium canescens]